MDQDQSSSVIMDMDATMPSNMGASKKSSHVEPMDFEGDGEKRAVNCSPTAANEE